MKRSVFFSEPVAKLLKSCAIEKNSHIENAAWWMNLSYDELAGLMFGPTIKRSWMVLSYGTCPACDGDVPMYDWKIDAKLDPWKLACPHCNERFPKNDFEAFYRSGLDDDGFFRRDKAEESLLQTDDPAGVGVDDGDGYVREDGAVLRFVGTYLIYGQWMQLVKAGLKTLSFAYMLTGERDYARRTMILLYRIARYFKGFDFREQGVMYEKEHTSRGYITYWANTPNDLIDMAIAYDMVADAIIDDREIEEYAGIASGDMCACIETNIFEEALANRERFESNPPYTDIAILVMQTVTGRLPKTEDIRSEIERIIRAYTRIDGLSGEKGLYGYASIAPMKIADLLLLYSNVDEKIISTMVSRIPALEKTYRFHLDTWYMEQYYPGVGDAGYFGGRCPEYVATLRTVGVREPYLRSCDWFTLRLYELYGDPRFAQALVVSRGSIEACFSDDPYIENLAEYRDRLKTIIDPIGTQLCQTSVLYDEWRIAVLHSGKDAHRRMLCINYDSGANHAHEDALNIGLFYHGRNLLPDLGYPPVHRGGWDTPEFHWYRRPYSHNLVVVDGRCHEQLATGSFVREPQYGAASLEGKDTWFQIVHADAKEYAGVKRYERTVALVDIDDTSCYCIDVFRVEGGNDHTMFLRTPLADVTTHGLSVKTGEEYGYGTFMRDFRTDPSPEVGWNVRFDLHPEDTRDASPTGLIVHPVTDACEATLCESWVDVTRGIGVAERRDEKVMWIPTLMLRRSGPQSTFVSVLEPFSKEPVIESVTRIAIDEHSFTLRVDIGNEMSDWIIIKDPQHVKHVTTEDAGIDAEACVNARTAALQSFISESVTAIRTRDLQSQ